MLIPIQHENMSARRWPVITLGLIVINIACFLFTMSSVGKESGAVAETREHILTLAASHPELTFNPETQTLIDNDRETRPGHWKQLSSEFRPLADGWDARVRLMVEQPQWQAEMERLEEEYAKLTAESLTENYAFVPGRKTPITYLTANFLHGGWLHLIGNMWFLWLAGFVLEDVWGRALYTVFYLLAGAAALQFYAWLNLGSLTPTLGASGAVAGLMGAFLVRFPKMKIEMAWLWIFFIKIRLIRFKVPAYALLPFWVAMEAFSGMLFGSSMGVAHWAHVGGFLFGAVVALGVRASGIEKSLTAKVTEEMELAHDPEIERATELIHGGKPLEALPILKSYVKARPDSVDGWTLLRQVYSRNADMSGYKEASVEMCGLHAKARELSLMEQDIADFIKAGGEKLPAALWLEVGGAFEHEREYERAVFEYENLAMAYPNLREAVLAQVATAKLYLKELQRPQEAMKRFQEAKDSCAPHVDLDAAIEVGIREATAALPKLDPKNLVAKGVAATAGVGGWPVSASRTISAWPSTTEINDNAESIADMGAAASPEILPNWVSIEPMRMEERAEAPSLLPAAGPKRTKPTAWGDLDAPPVWGHGAKGDRVEKPDFNEDNDDEHD